MANRHGLVTGATGTGKTVSLQTLAEHVSAIGVRVLMADVKGDLAGLAQPAATPTPRNTAPSWLPRHQQGSPLGRQILRGVLGGKG